MDTNSLFTEQEIDDYRTVVAELASTRSGRLIGTPSEEHAAIVYKHLFEQTSNEIYIYDKDLSGDLLRKENGSLELLQKIILDYSIKIVFVLEDIEEIIDEIEPLLVYAENVFFVEETEKFKQELKNILDGDYFFAVADKSMFRLELQNDGSRGAICSYNNETYSNRLLEVFKSVDHCTYKELRTIA